MVRRIGVMGGTFDPIHYGHLMIANEVLDKYNMEKIIFVPAGNPPHKKVTGACKLDRFLMTNIATLSNNKFIVSDIEIKSLEKSYTINTIRKLINEYDNTEVYFITGTDAILELPNWHDTENLLKICKFIGVSRSGYSTVDIETKINEIKSRYNGQIELLHVPMLEISSTDIRERIKIGRSVKYLLPEIVEDYIIKNNLYLEHKFIMNIEQMKIELEKSVGTKIFGHCVRTMEEAIKLAKIYNVEVEKAKIAGLLHDCGKLWDKQTDNLRHAKIGAELAKKTYNIEDVDILNAIRYHTTGREAMSLLEKIIYIADKIEPNRNFEGVEEMRELAYNNINEAIIKSLISTISFVKQRNLELDSESLKTLNYLNKRR